MSSTLVLGMGNPILSDDGVGLLVAERVSQATLPDDVEVRLSEVAGLRLLELVRGFTRVIIIDALRSAPEEGRKPGDIVRYGPEDFKGGHRYGSAHSIGLATCLELGESLGCDMPADVAVYAIEAEDIETFGEQLSPPVAAAAERVVGMVLADLGVAA